MPRTSPARASTDAGFTLAEVMVALVVATILLGVCAPALITALSSEERILVRREAEWAAQTLVARTELGEPVAEFLDLPGRRWLVRGETREATDGSLTRYWEVITLTAADQPESLVRLERRGRG